MSNTGSTIPNSDTDFLNWVNQHEQLWSSNYQRIGMQQIDANRMKDLTTASNTAWSNWQKAKLAAKAASEAWRDAKKANRAAAAADVKNIRTFASRSGNPTEVYQLAGIPAPKSPNFGVPPGTPGNVTVALDVNTGALDVRFECNNPPGLSGTVYVVSRCNSTAASPTVFGPWQQVAITSVKRFMDTTLVAGTPSIQYRIVAQRGSVVGNTSLPVTVSFGRVGNGSGFTVTNGETAEFEGTSKKSPKLAA